MDASEREILVFLQTWGSDFVSAKEVSRRASTKKRYNEDQDWAKPFLQIMTDRGVLDRDASGRYRVKPKPKKKHGDRWVSPEIAELLKENGLETDGTTAEASEENPEHD